MDKVSRQAEYLARKKLREQRRKNPAVAKGQLNFDQVTNREFQEKVRWKGGITREKNLPENFEEEA